MHLHKGTIRTWGILGVFFFILRIVLPYSQHLSLFSRCKRCLWNTTFGTGRSSRINGLNLSKYDSSPWTEQNSVLFLHSAQASETLGTTLKCCRPSTGRGSRTRRIPQKPPEQSTFPVHELLTSNECTRELHTMKLKTYSYCFDPRIGFF